MKRIAVDLAKSVYQVAESIHVVRMERRRRLDPGAFARYVQEQSGPVEWVMEACGADRHWGRLMQAAGHRVRLLQPRYVRAYRRVARPVAAIATQSRRRRAAPASGTGQNRASATSPAIAQAPRGLEEDSRATHQPVARHPARVACASSQRGPGIPASGLRADRAARSSGTARCASGGAGRNPPVGAIDERVRGATGALTSCTRSTRSVALVCSQPAR